MPPRQQQPRPEATNYHSIREGESQQPSRKAQADAVGGTNTETSSDPVSRQAADGMKICSKSGEKL